MAIWDEIFAPIARVVTRRSNKKEARKEAPLSASPKLLQRAAKPASRGIAGTLMDEAGAFFHPAGVFARNVGDAVIHPLDNLPFVGKGNTQGVTEALRALRGTRENMPESHPELPMYARGEEMRERREWGQAVLPSLDTVSKIASGAESMQNRVAQNPLVRYSPPLRGAVELSRAAMHPVDTWNRIFNGTNPGDGDLQAQLGSRGQELWAPIAADIERVKSTQRGDARPYVQRAADAVLPDSVAQYFDPSAPDIMSAASEAGFSPADALGISMANPLEWLGSPGKARLAEQLGDAAKTGRLTKALEYFPGKATAAPAVARVNKARAAINTAGRILDPVTEALDAGGALLSQARKIDWKLPSKKGPDINELKRLSGVDDATMQARLAEQAAPTAPASQAVPSSSWDDIFAEGVARDAAAPSMPRAESVPAAPDAAAVPSTWDDVLNAPKAEVPATRDTLMDSIDQELAGQEFAQQQALRSAASNASIEAKLASATPSALPVTDVADSVRWGDFNPGPRTAVPMEDALRADAPGAYNLQHAAFDPLHTGQLSPNAVEAVTRAPQSWEELLRREGPAESQAMRATGEQFAQDLAANSPDIEAKLASLSPRVLPQVEGPGARVAASLEDALKASDPGVSNPNPAAFDPLSTGKASPSTLDYAKPSESWDAALAHSPKYQYGVTRLNSNPLPIAGGAGVGYLVGGAPGALVGAALGGIAKPVVQGLADLNRLVGDAMLGLEARIGRGAQRVVDSNAALSAAQVSFKRVFDENFGVLTKEVGDRVADTGLAANAIRRVAQETVAPLLDVATNAERHALMNYMSRRIDANEAKALGLSDDFIAAGDGVRALMDDASDSLMAQQLNLDKRFLADSSTEGKELIRSLVETYKPGATGNRNRLAVLKAARDAVNAGTTYDAAFVAKAQNMVDAGLSQLEKQGFIDSAGNIVDMGLPLPAYIRNRGTYAPKLYKLWEYGVDIRSPKAASELLNAIDARGAAVAAEGGYGYRPIPADVRKFVLAHYTGGGAPSASVKTEAARLMKRKDVSLELQQVLAPLANPSYAYAKGIADVQLLTNTMKLRRWVAGQDRFVSRPGEAWEAFAKRTGTHEKDIAFDMAENPQYASRVGALKGRFIHRDMADLLAATGTIPHLGSPDSLDKLKEMSRTWLAMSKVILNPSSHFRQAYQNSIGVWSVSGLHAFKDIPEAVMDLKNKSGLYIEARDTGLFSAGHDTNLWSRLELEDMPEFTHDGNQHVLAKLARQSDYLGTLMEQASKGYTAAKNGVKSAVNKAGDAFSAGDDLAKLALYKHFRRQNIPPAEAARKVRSELYIGSKMSRYEQFMSGKSLRKTYYDRGARNASSNLMEGAGLVAFQPFFGAARFIWEQAYRNIAGVAPGSWLPMTDPARMARNATLLTSLYGLHELSKYSNGMTGKEESLERPDYQRPLMPTMTMLPAQFSQMFSEDGQHDWLDWSALHPFGPVTQGKWDVKSNTMSGLLDNAIATFVPGAGLASRFTGDGSNDPINPALRPLIEVFRDNRDSFSGRAIYPEQMGMQAKVRPAMAHLWRSYAPPWAPNPLGLAQAIPELPGLDEAGNAEKWKNAFYAGMQGLANDSGHQFSKGASAIVNSFEAWWQQHGGDASAARNVVDYRGRQQYLGKFLADVAGIRIESRAAGEMEELRGKRRDSVVSQIKREYGERLRNMKGDARDKLQDEMDAAIENVQSGNPDPRWYDEGPSDTLQNIFSMIAASRQRRPQRGQY